MRPITVVGMRMKLVFLRYAAHANLNSRVNFILVGKSGQSALESSFTQQHQSPTLLPTHYQYQTEVLLKLLSYHNKHRLLSNDAEISHGVNDAQKGLHRLGFLANHGFVDRQR